MDSGENGEIHGRSADCDGGLALSVCEFGTLKTRC